MAIDTSRPNTGADAFFEGATGTQNIFNSLMQNKLNPYQIELLKAQAEKAKGEGAQSQMIANLLGIAYPGGGADTSQEGMPSSSDQVKGMSEQNTQQAKSRSQQAKSILQAFGIIKETPEEQEARENRTNYKKELGTIHAKKIGELEDVAQAGIESQPTYDEAARITSSPEWAKMRDFPIAPGAQLEFYKRTGTPEQRDMIARFKTNTNQFILNSIKKFPQRFTNKDMSFMQQMKISDDDSLESGQAKLYSAMLYDQLMSKRAGLAAEIALRDGITPLKALQIADKQLNTDEIRSKIMEQVTGKPSKGNKPSNEEKPKTNSKGMVIIYKNGKEYHFPPEKMRQALAEGGTLEP